MLFAYVLVYSILLEISSPKNVGKQVEKLIMVHVLCRHGDRTPLSTYPEDIHINETYYPVGLGKLTNDGKVRSYKLGKYLRKRYNKFLGDIYLPKNIDVQTASVSRTKMSAQTILAALFPPVRMQNWNANLTWQPIPYDFVPEEYDYMFASQFSCKQLRTISKMSLIEDVKDNKFKENEKLFQYLSYNTGKEIKTVDDVYEIYDCLKCQNEWGLRLPSWAKNIFPDELKRVSSLSLDYIANTDMLRKLRAGFMFKKIIDDSKMKIKKTFRMKDRKLAIYSGHYSNIVAMLSLLGLYKRQFPPYSAFMLFEIYKRNSEYVMKVFYQDYTEKEPKRMKLPKCGYNCTFNKFVGQYKKFFATPNNCNDQLGYLDIP